MVPWVGLLMASVYVLGAGASCFAGYPLGPELWSSIRDRWSSKEVMATERRREVLHDMERVLQVFPPKAYDEPNLEELFTLLDLSLLIPDAFQLKNLDWKVARLNISGIIVDAFTYYQWDLQSLVYSGKRPVEEVTVNPKDVAQVLKAWQRE
jgi:hypothetical protein